MGKIAAKMEGCWSIKHWRFMLGSVAIIRIDWLLYLRGLAVTGHQQRSTLTRPSIRRSRMTLGEGKNAVGRLGSVAKLAQRGILQSPQIDACRLGVAPLTHYKQTANLVAAVGLEPTTYGL
jgi:hypothetical protein